MIMFRAQGRLLTPSEPGDTLSKLTTTPQFTVAHQFPPTWAAYFIIYTPVLFLRIWRIIIFFIPKKIRAFGAIFLLFRSRNI